MVELKKRIKRIKRFNPDQNKQVQEVILPRKIKNSSRSLLNFNITP